MASKYLLYIPVLSVLIFSAPPAHAKPAKCLLAVDDIVQIDGTCTFIPLSGTAGSFKIMAADGRYFAYLYVDHPDQGRGFWNEAPGAGHAHTPLEVLVRNGACWQNDHAKICAW
ncbi:hypothetical protein OS189_17110 [Sulfitobacter sp. F26169L]|uniref:hypothetical protein n=1 Tax=Sulfitobacter sp. F26169L TaxID=2996015 RepID=UPI002260B205|nr:hypothetical protein [Sulfitobacter sp. F26169L]MCX7568064.1 hypothetical protein [Sulfitobacter sp. F26169L]